MEHWFDLIMVPMQVFIFLFTIYYFIIGFCGMWRRKEDKILVPEKTFAVIVAAHNESAVIGQLLDNLHTLDYPKELYDIFVIAAIPAPSFANASARRGKAKGSRWSGCLTGCSRWSGSTTRL